MSKISSKRPPLRGRKALVVASRRTSAKLARGLSDLGADVEVFPALEIRSITDKSPMDRAIDRLANYEWVIFTSGYGVEFFLDRWIERKAPIGRWAKTKVCAVGPATREALEERGIRVSLVPSEFVAEGIVRALRGWYTQEAGLQGKQILLPQARVARDPIKRELEALGATVEIVPCYENVAPDPDPSLLESLDRFTPELMVFTSTSAVKHFFALVGEARARSLLEEAVVAALGPITQRALTERGLGVEILPAENTAASLLQAIAAHFQPQSH